MTAHSVVGASSAERWFACPGSVALIREIGEVESDELEYRQQGTEAHAVAAECLSNNSDAWEHVGSYETFDPEAAAAVQVYLDLIRDSMVIAAAPIADHVEMIEEHLSDPNHPDAFGTVDHAFIIENHHGEITDYKHGVGIAVDVERNPQLMYYAHLLQLRYPEVRTWKLRIVQPRGFHRDGPVREWEISGDDLAAWAETELYPRMDAALVGVDLVPGNHCRFCPGKLRCGALAAMSAAAASNTRALDTLTPGALAREYALLPALRSYAKAIDDEVYRRLTAGEEIETAKLVAKKADRQFKPEAEPVLRSRYGANAYTTPKLKSPAQVELLPGGKEMTREWAFAPQTGLTAVLVTDARAAVKPEIADPAARFGGG